MGWNYWGNFNSDVNIPVSLFFLLLFSQIHHGSKLPQTVGQLQCSSLLCWRTHHSYPAIDQEVTAHQGHTRRKMDIHIQSHKTDLHKRSVVNMGSKLYNKLPDYIKKINSYKAFRKELKSFLLLQTFYSVEKFVAL
jgi:hypothetical protein